MELSGYLQPHVLLILSLHILGISLGFYFLRFNKTEIKSTNLLHLIPDHLRRSFRIYLLALIVIMYIQFDDEILQTLPIFIQGYSSLIAWSLCAFIIALFSGIQFHICRLFRDKRKFKRLALMNLSFVIFSLYANTGIYVVLGDNVVKDNAILQSKTFTCAPASLANIAAFYKIPISEKEAAYLMHTTFTGTHEARIRYALNELGFPFEILNRQKKHLRAVTAPAILFIDHPLAGPESHAVVFMGEENGKFVIIDPMKGREHWNEVEISKKWHGRGISVLPRKSSVLTKI